MKYLLLCFLLMSSCVLQGSDGGKDSVLLRQYESEKSKGHIPEAMSLAERILSSVDSTDVDMSEVAMSEELAGYLDKSYRYSDAARWRRLAVAGYLSSGEYGLDYARNELELAKLYYRTGKFHKAFDHVNNALEVYSDSRGKEEYLQCINLLGALYYACREYDKSSGYFRQCASEAEKAGDTAMLALALNNIAVYVNGQSDSLKTKEILQKCAELCRQSGNRSLLARVYINMSLMSIRSKSYEDAGEYLEMARPFLTNVGESGLYYYYTGMLEYYEGDAAAAVTALKKAADMYSLGEFGSRYQACLELLQEVYASEGDYEHAYNTLYQYYVNSRQYDREGAVIELFKARNERMLNEQREKDLSRKRELALWLTLGFAVLAVIAAVIIIMYKRREFDIRRREQELASRKEIEELKQMQQYKTDCLVDETIGNLNRLSAGIEDSSLKGELARICNDLRDTKKKDEWMETKSFVPKFNSDFYRNLIQAFPALTLNERRLCVFLNMNLTTKEISDITRQSVQSINTARGRLRRKLGINGDNVSIQEFLSKYN